MDTSSPDTLWSTPVTGTPAWWQWGSRRIWVDLDDTEVRVGTVGGDDPFAETRAAGEPGEAPADAQRFARGTGTVVWSARTADRSVVVRPATPLTVLGHARAVIFVSTPLWIGLKEQGRAEPFFEVPSTRPSTTWFGATPQAGELAYASRSRARTRLADVEFRPGRVTTRITLVNALDTAWEVARLKVPVPHLPLFVCAESRVWSAAVRIVSSGDVEVDVEVEGGAGPEAGPSELLTPARQVGTPRLVLRALGKLGWS